MQQSMLINVLLSGILISLVWPKSNFSNPEMKIQHKKNCCFKSARVAGPNHLQGDPDDAHDFFWLIPPSKQAHCEHTVHICDQWQWSLPKGAGCLPGIFEACRGLHTEHTMHTNAAWQRPWCYMWHLEQHTTALSTNTTLLVASLYSTGQCLGLGWGHSL